ncbi:hypothetical protein KR009_007910, partial [Drosophila setifemur]
IIKTAMSRRDYSTTSLVSSTSTFETSLVSFRPNRKFLKNAGTKLKLIALYADHECLWNQFHKDFFNLPKREVIWEAIADEMILDSPPDFWKHMIHRLRYNVELERLHELEAKRMGKKVANKLYYSDSFKFLDQMFLKKKIDPPKIIPLNAPSSGVILEKKTSSRHSRPPQEKAKPRYSFSDKLATFERVRNHQHCNLVLSQKAFRKMQRITSEGVKLFTKEKAKG